MRYKKMSCEKTNYEKQDKYDQAEQQ